MLSTVMNSIYIVLIMPLYICVHVWAVVSPIRSSNFPFEKKNNNIMALSKYFLSLMLFFFLFSCGKVLFEILYKHSIFFFVY